MKTFKNPLINADFPDPSLIFVPGEGYYAYGSHDEFSPTINNIQVSFSKDLENWSKPSGALSQLPKWAETCEKFWAPHVVFFEGEYRMYYSAEPDDKKGMAIALAVSRTPTDFEDIGTPLFSAESYKMIDPCYFIDPVSGRHFLYFGSAHEPIRVIEMEESGRVVKGDPIDLVFPEQRKYESLREGAFVSYKKEWNRYYLWVSGNNTWKSGEYAVTLFISSSPTGPFERYETLLKEDDRWDAPGQNSLVTDEEGNDYIFYHAVDRKDPYIPGTQIFLRKMCAAPILYSKDGWPKVVAK
jgi:arabinan endo-1,5-alpha-L-arabinosidase